LSSIATLQSRSKVLDDNRIDSRAAFRVGVDRRPRAPILQTAQTRSQEAMRFRVSRA
jgi:hypothetical protein